MPIKIEKDDHQTLDPLHPLGIPETITKITGGGGANNTNTADSNMTREQENNPTTSNPTTSTLRTSAIASTSSIAPVIGPIPSTATAIINTAGETLSQQTLVPGPNLFKNNQRASKFGVTLPFVGADDAAQTASIVKDYIMNPKHFLSKVETETRRLMKACWMFEGRDVMEDTVGGWNLCWLVGGRACDG